MTSRASDYTDDPDFAAWMDEVDQEVYRIAEVSVFDLEDYTFHSAWEAGISPEDAAIDALDNDDLYTLTDF